MKVKDFKGENLVGLKVRIPKKYEDSYTGIKGDMYLESVWNAGVWLSKNPNATSKKLYPLCIDPKLVLDFTIVKEK